MMQQIKLPQLIKENSFMPNSYCVDKIVESINTYIEHNYSEQVSVDISFLNAIDSLRVSTMCSTFHFIKYPQGKITWKVSSNIIDYFNKDLNLGNIEFQL